jgi:energy-coupling factor transporter ATP-binding protein EcfA2
MAQHAVIEVRDISQRVRGGRMTLNGVSLTIVAGELVAIIGGSGASKTTLLDTICGLVPPAAGGRAREPAPGRGRCENGGVNHTTGYFPTGRSRGVTVAVDGFFALMWFGWGQAAAPSWLVVPLAVGTGLAALLAAAGVMVARRSAGRLPAVNDPVVRRRYNVIVGLEFGLLVAGAAVLGVSGQYRWAPVWICFGVGVHFFPLASTLDNPSLRPLGMLLIAVAAAALMAGLASTVAPSTITGPGAGLCLLAFGLATLLTRAPRRVLPADEPAPL